MKKRWMLLIIAVVFGLAACNSETEKKEPKDVQEKNNHIEQKANEQKSEEEDTEDAPETEIEKKESDEEEETNDSSAETEDVGQSDEEVEEKNDEDKEEMLTDYEFADLGYAIFEAQAKKDYDYVESVLSEGSTLQSDTNTIQFDNVTYPHTYEMISKEDFANLDDRYVQDEDDDSVIVGFVVTDYENESSYIIDVQFIKENGKWKLNDMDINK